MKQWLLLMKLIRFSMLHRDKAELVFIWHRLEKKHRILEQQRLLKMMICYSHNIENQVLSFGVVFLSNKWHINCVATTLISVRVNRCQYIMDPRIWIFVLLVHHYAHRYLKHLALDINIGLITKIKLPSHTLEKELPQRVISIQLWTSPQPWDAKHSSIAETICMLSRPQLTINTQEMESPLEDHHTACQLSEWMEMICLPYTLQPKRQEKWSSQKRDQF